MVQTYITARTCTAKRKGQETEERQTYRTGCKWRETGYRKEKGDRKGHRGRRIPTDQKQRNKGERERCFL